VAVARVVRLAMAQMGPNDETQPRSSIVNRMVSLLRKAIAERAEVVVFPELALTTFFPKRIRSDYEQFFDSAMPNPTVAPLFDLARRARVAFCFGYAESVANGNKYNTMIYVDERGDITHRYRKLHLPGLPDVAPAGQVRVYEPHYFNHGDTDLRPVQTSHGSLGIAICQDRRYPEVYRALGLAGAELIVIGYNTPASPLAISQNELCVRAGAYENSLFVVAVAKAGNEDGVHLIGGSCAVDPHGQVVARTAMEGDEVAVVQLDFSHIASARERWNFYGRRHPDRYGILTEPVNCFADPLQSRVRG